MREYTVLILRRAQKELARLPGGAYEHVRDAIRALVIARRLEPPKQSPHVPHECSCYSMELEIASPPLAARLGASAFGAWRNDTGG